MIGGFADVSCDFCVNMLICVYMHFLGRLTHKRVSSNGVCGKRSQIFTCTYISRGMEAGKKKKKPDAFHTSKSMFKPEGLNYMLLLRLRPNQKEIHTLQFI